MRRETAVVRSDVRAGVEAVAGVGVVFWYPLGSTQRVLRGCEPVMFWAVLIILSWAMQKPCQWQDDICRSSAELGSFKLDLVFAMCCNRQHSSEIIHSKYNHVSSFLTAKVNELIV